MVDYPPDHVPLAAGSSPATNPERLTQAMNRWRRRSRMIRFWRIALPLLMVAISGAVLTLVAIRTLYANNHAADQNQEIRMTSPKFFGRDKSGRPFTVTAVSAVRGDPAHLERVGLDKPHMVLQSLNGDPPTKVDAATGLYNENTHMLALDNHVTLDDGKGDVFVSEHALVNTDAGTVDGRSPVSGSGPLGQTSASAYAIDHRGAHIVFMGNVKSHLVNK